MLLAVRWLVIFCEEVLKLQGSQNPSILIGSICSAVFSLTFTSARLPVFFCVSPKPPSTPFFKLFCPYSSTTPTSTRTMMALPAFSTAAVMETTSDASSEAPATPTGTQDAFERMRERSRKLTFEEQLGPENHANDTSAVDIQDLPFLTHHRRRYIRDSNVARIGDSNRKRQRRSWIGRWGVFLREIDKDYRALEDYWLCRLCDKRYSTQLYADAATTSAIEHLRRAHGIDNRTRVEDWIDKRERGVTDLFSSAAKQKGRRITTQNEITKIQETAVGVIVTSNVPSTFFCNRFVQSLMRTQTGGHIVDTVSWGPHAIREALQLVYSDRRKYIQSFLRFAETKIHITFDLWTSPNNKAYLSVCAHFLDASFSKKDPSSCPTAALRPA